MTRDEADLRFLIEQVRTGRLARRTFVRQMIALGLSAAYASLMLMHAGVAHAEHRPGAYKPTRRGGGGTLRMLFWQAPTLLNPHFGVGSKDQAAAHLFCEPLASFDGDGNLFPVLAAGIPSLANGGVARDGTSVTWKLKRGVLWHDGKPFTADDVVATWEFARNPDSATFSLGIYQHVTVQKLDSHTVRVSFAQPTPIWADAFIGALGGILPAHHFAAYIGSKSRDAPANLRPVGTGPYRFVDFRPGDYLRAELNPDYHMPNRPYFDSVEIKGGGDAVSAARAVLQTGEFDIAWNVQVEDEVLARMEAGGRGRAHFADGGDIEFIMLNHADPWTEVDGERSSPATRHPFLLDPAVRQALAHLVDRDSIQRFVYGRGGISTVHFLNNPERFNSNNGGAAFDVAKANALLDAGGWVRVRSKNGRRLKMLFQTSINAPRQKTQAIVKQAAQKAGIELELKATTGSVFFSSDVANPDTAAKFYADLQMYTTLRGGPDPGRFMELFCSWLIASKANKWQGRNVIRWRNDEYDRTFRAAEGELDPVRRAAMLIRLNDLVCGDLAVIPLLCRPRVTAVAANLYAPLSGWGLEYSQIHDWHRT
jgi:peptide/nickel transport system substrate-binding protein